jgi:hypothetical protein
MRGRMRRMELHWSNHGTAGHIEGFGHPRAPDGAGVKHLADRHRPPRMRQQQLCGLNLALADEALSFVPADTEVERCIGSCIRGAGIVSRGQT